MSLPVHIPLDLGYRCADGLIYSDLLIDRELKRVYVITGASCAAVISSLVGELYGLLPGAVVRRFLVVFNGPSRSIDLSRLPKKYAKFQIISQ